MPTNFRRETYSFSNGKTYTFRSGWESNYAFYLDWLYKQGEIKDWEYEPLPRYEFIVTEGNYQRALSLGYLPDFKVTNNDGHKTPWYLVEIKGKPQGMRKLQRMKKFYPKVKIELIDRKAYADLKRKVGKMLNWD